MNHYMRLALMTVLSFIAMYILMYAMVARFDDVFLSWNQAYMAALMTAPMVMIELALMGSMYENRQANLTIFLASLAVLAASWFAIREQWGIGDRQFLRSMIPHHSGAVLMCEEAPVTDPVIADLCRSIVESQNREIDQMRALLNAKER